ncbi:MAG: hypothetical protein LW806_05160 [Planctomycetaceae bacterium]|nr:hypothetical protein [Planctomycetaceae bacterium]
MPRKASYTLPTIRGLVIATPARAASSRELTLRQMHAAEAIIASIDPRRSYELGDALTRIVGQPLSPAGEPVLGATLRTDLVTLVLDLSESLGLDGSERAGGAATPEDLAREIGVASKTLQRWRRNGLCAHWVQEAGKLRVAIYRASLEAFRVAHPAEFARACAFKRFDSDERTRMIEEGRRLIADGRSLNLAAKEMATRYGRSHEGVRLLFLRELGIGRAPRRSLGERAGRLAERAWRLGIDPAKIARRLGKSESLVRALVDRRRGELLRSVQPSWIELPTFELPGADETIPAAPAVRRLAPLGLVDGDVLAAIASARKINATSAKDPRAAAERDEARAAAMHYLLRRASRATDALDKWPERARIDQIETDLRTALRLRAALVERGLVIALGRADQYCHGGPERLPSDELRQLARAIAQAVRDVVHAFDPSRQRFDRAISLAADLALAKLVNTRRNARAAARHTAAIEFRMLDEVAQWQGVVDGFVHHAPAIAAELAARGPRMAHARILSRRYGWNGFLPATVERLAQEDRTTVAMMSKRLRDAENAFRAHAG